MIGIPDDMARRQHAPALLPPPIALVGRSPTMQLMREELAKIAAHDVRGQVTSTNSRISFSGF
jgi:hypothetical protein